MSRLLKLLRSQGEEGQAYIEFLVILPPMVLLVVLVGGAFWLWWNQNVAAVAIHVGTAEAARSLSLEAGYQATTETLAMGVGRYALTYDGDYSIVLDPGRRAMIGRLDHPMRIVGTVARVRSGAFHRWEQFWPGPPSYWW